MKINEAGLQIIKEFEGLRLKAYRDTGGVLTVGYGHTSAAGDPRVTTGLIITEDEADAILRRDVAGAERDVAALVTVPLNENQFSALVSFVFNLGRSKVANSTLIRKLNAGQDAAPEFDRWVYDNGKKLNGLVRRRAAERSLFETPVEGALDPRVELQTILHRLGLYTARVDGAWGPKSQAALQSFNTIAADVADLQTQLEQ